MKVVVMGGAGKVGRYVVRELLRDEDGRPAHDVSVFDRAASAELPVPQTVGDHADFEAVAKALEGAEAVIHLSAYPGPGLAPDHVLFQSNVAGTFNVHDAASRMGVRRVVTLSSESILGWTFSTRPFVPDYLPIDEEHPLRPQDAYALSKEAGEAVARSFTEGAYMETVALRASWVVSPEELNQLRVDGGRVVSVFAPCNYIDVRDVATACRLAIEQRLVDDQCFFIIADDSSVAEPLSELLPRLAPWIDDTAKELTGDRPSITNEWAKRKLGWAPVHSWRRPDIDG